MLNRNTSMKGRSYERIPVECILEDDVRSGQTIKSLAQANEVDWVCIGVLC